MKCNRCSRNKAEIIISSLKDEQKLSVGLCPQCSSVLGLNSELSKIGFSVDCQTAELTPDKTHSAQCPECSTSIDTFLDTGQAGCVYCYVAFKDLISRNYRGTSEPPNDKQNITHLSDLMNDAVLKENYEYAASLRDRISVLSSGEAEEN